MPEERVRDHRVDRVGRVATSTMLHDGTYSPRDLTARAGGTFHSIQYSVMIGVLVRSDLVARRIERALGREERPGSEFENCPAWTMKLCLVVV